MSSIAIGDIVRVTAGPRLNHLGEVKQLAQLARDVDGSTNHARRVVASVSNGAETIEITATSLKVVHKSKQPNNLATVVYLLVGLGVAYLGVRFGLDLAHGHKFTAWDAGYHAFMAYVGVMTIFGGMLLRPKRVQL